MTRNTYFLPKVHSSGYHLAMSLSGLNWLSVVISVIAMFKEIQEYNRKVIDNYFEVFLDVPFDVLKSRDQKGIYFNAEKVLPYMAELYNPPPLPSEVIAPFVRVYFVLLL